MKRILIALLFVGSLCAAEPIATPLSLDEAVALALKRSKGAQIAQAKMDEADAAARSARSLRYPTLAATALGTYLVDPVEVKISQGSLTAPLNQVGAQLGMGSQIASLGQFPSQDMTLARGSHTPVIGDLTLTQPVSQLLRIESGVRAAKAAQAEARREYNRTTAQLRYGVEELFVGSLLERQRTAQKTAELAHLERQLHDAENAQHVGELLEESVLGMRAAVIQARAELTRSRQQVAKLSLQLADLIGRPGEDALELTGDLPVREAHPLDYWTKLATENPDRQIAAATVEKAAAAVRAARQARIPDVSLLASGYAQDGIPLVARHSGAVGVMVSWDIFDFGKKDAEISRTLAQRRAAELNRDRLEEDAGREIRLAHQDYVYAGELIALAEQALEYRRRAAERAHQSAGNGVALESAALDADAQLRKAETDLSGARYQRHLALLRLNYLAGKL